MTTGFGKLQQHLQEQAARASSITGRAGWFKLAQNESKFIRFLDDEILTEQFAQGVTGYDGKKNGYLIPDPNDNLVVKLGPPGCWDGKLKSQSVGMAVELEEELIPPPPPAPGETAGPPVGPPKKLYKDKITRRDDGTAERHFLIVLQSHGNFWDKMVGFFGVYHTICDRPYKVTRMHSGLDTDYQIAPLDAPADDPLRDYATMQQHYGYGHKWDKDDPNRFWWCPQTLEEWKEDYGSERRIRYFLLGEREDGQKVNAAAVQPQSGQPDPWAAQNNGQPQPPGPPPPNPAPSADFEELKSRLSSNPPAPVTAPPVGSGPPPAIPPPGMNSADEPPF